MNRNRLLSQVESRMPFVATVRLDSDLFDDLGFDSILLLDLILALEAEFDCRFTDEELTMEQLSTPGKLLALVEKHYGN